MDNGNEGLATSMEAGIGIHRNLYHGNQPGDRQVLQSCGELQLSLYSQNILCPMGLKEGFPI